MTIRRRTTWWTTFVAGLLLLLIGGTARADARDKAVPPAATELAEEILEQQWKVRGGYHRKVTGYTNEELLAAHLGVPFVECELRDESLDEFLRADQEDSRPFANIIKYSFPVVLEGDARSVGAIVILRNRDIHGNKIVPDGPEYMKYGYYTRGEKLVDDALILAERLGSTVYVVWFRGTPIERRFVVDDGSGVLSGTKADSLVPAGEDTSFIRRTIVDSRRQLKAMQEQTGGSRR